MKNLKRAAAVIAAAVLCMGMSVSTFASSVTDPTIPGSDQTEINISYLPVAKGTDKDGNKVTARATYVSEEVEEILKDEDKVKEILSDAGYEVKEDQNVVVLGAGDFELVGSMDWETHEYTKLEMPEGGVDLAISIPYSIGEGIENGDTLYVLHQKADGTWEVLEGEAVVETTTYGEGEYAYSFTTYKVKAHFDSLSPVAVIKVMSNGDVVVLDEKEEVIDNVDINEIVKPNTDSSDKEDSNVVTEENKDNTAVTDKEEQNDEISSDKETTNEVEKEETKEETVEGQKAQTEKSSSAVKTSSTVKKSPKTGNF